VQSAKLDAKSSTSAPFSRMLFAGLSISSAAAAVVSVRRFDDKAGL
jgi:hypothetical protein